MTSNIEGLKADTILIAVLLFQRTVILTTATAIDLNIVDQQSSSSSSSSTSSISINTDFNTIIVQTTTGSGTASLRQFADFNFAEIMNR